MPRPHSTLSRSLAVVPLVAIVALVAFALTATFVPSHSLDDQRTHALRLHFPHGHRGAAPVPSGDPDSVEPGRRKLRIGLAGKDHPHQPSVYLPTPNSTAAPPPTTSPPRSRWSYALAQGVDKLGDLLLALFGFDEADWFGLPGFDNEDEHDLDELGLQAAGSSGLASWSESSVYVERTNSLHPSRPSSFGPHLVTEPLRGLLFPIPHASPASDSFGCSALPSPPSPPIRARIPAEGWIALVQRGHCPFSQKVRFAQAHGARAVVFGDEDETEGGIRGGHGLLTPWSPDDTSDISIPSTFVSRASYLSLLSTWEDEQLSVEHISTAEGESSSENERDKEFVGLEVVLSKDDLFAWPLLDLLFLLLFLPSLLTLLTVFTQRVRLARAQKAERAPKDAVARLAVFRWGDTEKGSTDEEQSIGVREAGAVAAEGAEPPTEWTSLLRPTSPTISTASAPSPTFLQRLSTFLHLPRPSARSASPASSVPSHARPRLPLRRYPSLCDCAICLDAFSPPSIVMELPCGHLFHRDCAMSWLLEQRGICPICRRSVLDDAPGMGEGESGGEGGGEGDGREAQGGGEGGEGETMQGEAEDIPLREPQEAQRAVISPVASTSSRTIQGEI
ncbi:hypothetical protein JCM21900_003009, partial [Sporobolomyces salmonicolor]